MVIAKMRMLRWMSRLTSREHKIINIKKEVSNSQFLQELLQLLVIIQICNNVPILLSPEIIRLKFNDQKVLFCDTIINNIGT